LRKASILLIPCLIGGVLIAGCGGDDSSDSTATALTKSEYLKQGNAICAKGGKATDQLANQAFSKNQKPTQAQLEQFTSQAAPIVQQHINGLKALGAPAGDEQQVNTIIDDAQSALDEVKQDPSQFLKGDPFKKANQEAEAYGLTACGG